jgi:hypothetical protein
MSVRQPKAFCVHLSVYKIYFPRLSSSLQIKIFAKLFRDMALSHSSVSQLLVAWTLPF